MTATEILVQLSEQSSELMSVYYYVSLSRCSLKI
jgi:hypothetical protein